MSNTTAVTFLDGGMISTTNPTSNVSESIDGDGKNDSDNKVDVQLSVTGYFETTLLGVLAVVGLIGNILIMKTSLKVETKFARQIMTLFFSLAVGDALVCSVRIPVLILPTLGIGHSHILCILWQMSSATVGTVIWKNFLVGFQRIFIMNNFQCYRKYFTFSVTLVLIIATWILQWTVHIGLTRILSLQFTYQNELVCSKVFLTYVENVFLRCVTFGFLGITPLLLTTGCHIWIMFCIIRFGLTRLENKDDRSSFYRITVTAGMRIILLLCCWGPYLLVNAIDPQSILIGSNMRKYLDYLLCLQSVLSPYISLGDSDFKDSQSRKRSQIASLRTMRLHSSFRQSCKLAGSYMTSGDLKTNGATE